MTERDTGEREQTPQELKQELFDYLQDAEFGMPKFQALADWLNLRKHEGYLEDRLRQLDSASDKQYRKSLLRVEELHIAFLEHKIENNRSTIPGYSAAYTHIYLTVDTLLTSLLRERAQEGNSVDNHSDVAGDLITELWEEYYRKEGD